MKAISKVDLRLGNRDGDLFAVLADDGHYYLVLQCDTFKESELFEGLGPTRQIPIPAEVFHALSSENK